MEIICVKLISLGPILKSTEDKQYIKDMDMPNGVAADVVTLKYAEKPLPPMAILAASQIGGIELNLRGDSQAPKDMHPSLIFSDG